MAPANCNEELRKAASATSEGPCTSQIMSAAVEIFAIAWDRAADRSISCPWRYHCGKSQLPKTRALVAANIGHSRRNIGVTATISAAAERLTMSNISLAARVVQYMRATASGSARATEM